MENQPQKLTEERRSPLYLVGMATSILSMATAVLALAIGRGYSLPSWSSPRPQNEIAQIRPQIDSFRVRTIKPRVDMRRMNDYEVYGQPFTSNEKTVLEIRQGSNFSPVAIDLDNDGNLDWFLSSRGNESLQKEYESIS
ncbi:MAG: hypothetical protein ABIG28_01000 [archaeon]